MRPKTLQRPERPSDPPPRRRRRGWAALGVVLLVGAVGAVFLLYYPLDPLRLPHLPNAPLKLPQFGTHSDPAKSRPGASPALRPPEKLTGFGASEQSWNQTHKRVADTNSYDADDSLPAVEVHHARYASVEMVQGRVVGFVMVFHSGTPIAEARQQVMLQLPHDAVVVKFSEEARCAQMEAQSSTLARALDSLDAEGRVYVHFVSANPDLSWGYNPADVRVAQIDRNPGFARSNVSC